MIYDVKFTVSNNEINPKIDIISFERVYVIPRHFNPLQIDLNEYQLYVVVGSNAKINYNSIEMRLSEMIISILRDEKLKELL